MKTLLNAYFKGGTSTGGPLDINGVANTGTAFDTAILGGLGEAACIVTFGNVAADTTALKIEESDDNSSWGDVTSGAFSGTALPTAAAGDNKLWLFHLELGGARKRYLRVSCTPGAAATLYGAVWIGLSPAQGINGSNEIARGAAQNLGNSSSLLGRIVL
jgi:hypothetical protein